MPKSKLLFIDAYDSFSNNIVSLLETNLDVSVEKITIDSTLPRDQLDSFAGIVIGPGPGNPYTPEDIGCIKDVWALSEKEVLPVLGICLGFQSLVVEFGGEVRQLPYPRHGIKTKVTTSNDSIFKGLEEVEVVQYHSLHGTLGHHSLEGSNLWSPSVTCPDLVPIAWDQNHTYSKKAPSPDDPRAKTGALNPRRILMGVRHASRPYFGVQYHPESVLSSANARQSVLNWYHIAQAWNEAHRPRRQLHISPSACEHCPTKPIYTKALDVGSLNIPAIREIMSRKYGLGDEIIILDSEMNQLSNLGRHSIVGLVFPDTLKMNYTIGSGKVTLRQGYKTSTEDLARYEGNVVHYLKSFMEDNKFCHSSPELPFFGGLMGYIDYEACLETIGVPSKSKSSRPNLSFAFVERSVVVNHETQRVFVQSIRREDQAWVDEAAGALGDLTATPDRHSEVDSSAPSLGSSQSGSPRLGSSNSSNWSDVPASKTALLHPPEITPPREAVYCDKVRDCHKEIRKGNSYELCLTGTTEIQAPVGALSSWSRYLHLRATNPATFGAYVRLGPVTVLSSSPERFMSWTRPNAAGESVCQFRPIKGTVKKHVKNADGTTTFTDLETATKLLGVAKEQAENLMIADLIRHDLASVVGSGNVKTKGLMQVEEYHSVYQLVTVIEGILKPPMGPVHGPEAPRPQLTKETGIDVLGASLPPGSMTGAPKKRSCELLTGIEDQKPRSIYSGVLGYMDVGGGGDFSVCIRVAYRWDDDIGPYYETWRIGAGGAVTDLSSPMGEYLEMKAKLDCVLESFESHL